MVLNITGASAPVQWGVLPTVPRKPRERFFTATCRAEMNEGGRTQLVAPNPAAWEKAEERGAGPSIFYRRKRREQRIFTTACRAEVNEGGMDAN
jgi:hypothetical protein